MSPQQEQHQTQLQSTPCFDFSALVDFKVEKDSQFSQISHSAFKDLTNGVNTQDTTSLRIQTSPRAVLLSIDVMLYYSLLCSLVLIGATATSYEPPQRHEFLKKYTTRNMPLYKVLPEAQKPQVMGVDATSIGWINEYTYVQQDSCSSVSEAQDITSYVTNQCLTYTNYLGNTSDSSGNVFGSSYFYCSSGLSM